ncbi:ORF224 [White spot syndrome virus]|uniref:ORF224 n=1 Tax=White spot syndrome virus TaxID=342409 RepID=A0A2D3I6I6_9VIRU|nr:ORF224 [White spot syndrome virus]
MYAGPSCFLQLFKCPMNSCSFWSRVVNGTGSSLLFILMFMSRAFFINRDISFKRPVGLITTVSPSKSSSL